MKRIELPSPILRESELTYREFQYPIKELKNLPPPLDLPATPLQAVLSSRKSERNYGAMSDNELSSLLWHSARVISANPPSNPIRWQHRPVASAGGRHPIDLLIMQKQGGRYNAFLYNPLAHCLAFLNISGENELQEFTTAINLIIPLQDATIIWLGAQFDRTLARYEHGESLVWRDAGGIIAVLSLVAEALNLNCCPIGITGEPFLSNLIPSDNKVVGVGGLLIGSRN
jgi:SagB-type dehydrogenase family enzyme